MTRWMNGCAALTVAAAAAWVAGCGGAGEDQGPAPGGGSTTTAAGEAGETGAEQLEHGEHAGGEQGEQDEGAEGEVAEALAALSPEDRALAEKQRICPVSGEPLGSMGTPVKIEVEGKTVLLCCSGCEDAIRAEPQKYLARLER